ncbi:MULTISPECIES: hypothetical protein [unclassified Mesorhizobium]|nr:MULTISPECIES: hypothetical protein [unclassified Mesorhizobium]
MSIKWRLSGAGTIRPLATAEAALQSGNFARAFKIDPKLGSMN